MSYLPQFLVCLTAAVVIVPIVKKMGLGSVLGYLVAGVLVGPSLFRLITDVQSILHFSEMGVVFLLFIIGLELEPRRLWLLRKIVFGIGGLQVGITTLVFTLIAMSFGLTATASLVVALGLALSSTAFILATLSEKGQLSTTHGNVTFGVLLFQDLAVIPAMAALPLLVTASVSAPTLSPMMLVGKALSVFIALILAGRFLIRPLFKFIASTKNQELFTAASLLIVVGTGLLMEQVGLSMSLGAFSAGVLLANSEYRHELEANIEPFRGLLMGLFFMGVGMSTRFPLLVEIPWLVGGLVVGFMALKMIVMYAIAKLSKVGNQNAVCLAINLAVGGEFAFVLFGLAGQYGILTPQIGEILILTVTLSMVISPLLFVVKDKIVCRGEEGEPAREFDKINEPQNEVIIAGFGRFGQIVGRLLRTQKINYTALESSAQQVDFVRKFGSTLYYGDASHLELLRAAKADRAKVFVCAIDDQASSLKTVEMVKKHFPHLTIYARARNRQHAFALLDRGVNNIYRETFLSSLEVGEHVLTELGLTPEKIRAASDKFRRYDEDTIRRQHAAQIHKDERKLQEDGKHYAKVLENLMELDETVVGR